MSFSTTARSTADRRTTSSDNASGRSKAPTPTYGGSRADSRRPLSPSASGPHKRTVSGSQRTSKNVEEKRTERVQVTTRETLTSRTKSPDRRPAPPPNPEKGKASENVKSSAEYRPKSSKGEIPQGSIRPCRDY